MLPVIEGIIVGIAIGLFNRFLRVAEVQCASRACPDKDENMYQSSGIEADVDAEGESTRNIHHH